MNCKPGDLAIVVAAPAIAKRAIGSIVRCVELFDGFGTGPMWTVEPPAAGHYWGIKDRWLRPIRDPGDDAVDEVLQLVGAPSKEGVTA